MQTVKVYFNHFGQRFLCGFLVNTKQGIAFEYDSDFLKQNIQISPFMLPLQKGIFFDEKATFDGLFGVFDDSLPDGWGRLLLDRELRKIYGRTESISPLQRLAFAGCNGMGALEYQAEYKGSSQIQDNPLNLDRLADQCLAVLLDTDMPLTELQKLRTLNGSSGGARPKILVNIVKDAQGDKLSLTHGQPWIIKFRNHQDGKRAGLDEYVFSLLARQAGILMPESRLFPSKTCDGFFGVRRFDRNGEDKVHTHSVCGLLHANFRVPCMSYNSLLRLTKILTKNNEDIKNMYRLMVFNIAIKNRDDHTKNFAFMLDKQHTWRLAPAYDLCKCLTQSEHATTVNDKGKDIQPDDLVNVAVEADLDASFARECIREIYGIVSTFHEVKQRVFGSDAITLRTKRIFDQKLTDATPKENNSYTLRL